VTSTATSDLYDRHGETVRVLELQLRSYGGRRSFSGELITVKCHEDNSRVKEMLGQPGAGKVLVVDGGGSLRCALLGDLIAADAVKNGWRGVLIFGAVRDTDALAQLELGVYALGSTPRKSVRRGEGQSGLSLSFGAITIHQGEHIYVDADGVLVSSVAL
jgi:regulator of ribonuclease activity A